jgi:hypothetical protein
MEKPVIRKTKHKEMSDADAAAYRHKLIGLGAITPEPEDSKTPENERPCQPQWMISIYRARLVTAGKMNLGPKSIAKGFAK